MRLQSGRGVGEGGAALTTGRSYLLERKASRRWRLIGSATPAPVGGADGSESWFAAPGIALDGLPKRKCDNENIGDGFKWRWKSCPCHLCFARHSFQSVVDCKKAINLVRSSADASPPYGFMLLPGTTSSGFAMKLSSFPVSHTKSAPFIALE
jgi:hypothetical protein